MPWLEEGCSELADERIRANLQLLKELRELMGII
jgi:hypothetical protein